MRSFNLEDEKLILSSLRTEKRLAHDEVLKLRRKIDDQAQKIRRHINRNRPKRRAIISYENSSDYIVYGIRDFVVENSSMFCAGDVDLSAKQCRAEMAIGKLIRGDHKSWKGWTLIRRINPRKVKA